MTFCVKQLSDGLGRGGQTVEGERGHRAEKDYSPNKEALKVDYLVGLPSLSSRGGQVLEHG